MGTIRLLFSRCYFEPDESCPDLPRLRFVGDGLRDLMSLRPVRPKLLDDCESAWDWAGGGGWDCCFSAVTCFEEKGLRREILGLGWSVALSAVLAVIEASDVLDDFGFVTITLLSVSLSRGLFPGRI